jgi:hypothetical protein
MNKITFALIFFVVLYGWGELSSRFEVNSYVSILVAGALGGIIGFIRKSLNSKK